MAAVIVSSAVRVGVSWAKCRRDTLAMTSQHLGQHDLKSLTRWWQLKYFLCSPLILGKMNPFWRAYFSKGLVQPPTSDGLGCLSQLLSERIDKDVKDIYIYMYVYFFYSTQSKRELPEDPHANAKEGRLILSLAPKIRPHNGASKIACQHVPVERTPSTVRQVSRPGQRTVHANPGPGQKKHLQREGDCLAECWRELLRLRSCPLTILLTL